MHISVVSLFPDAFRAITEHGITRRAVEKGLIQLDLFNPREFTQDKHRTVDDKPYGGGPGMLMKVQPLRDAIESASKQATGKPRVIYLSPQGRTLRQEDLQEFAQQPELILVAGRYEGIDERLIESMVDEEVSIGDFVLSGGELPAMVLIDGITRLLPGAVGDAESVEQESFAHGLLDYPHYTRPEEVDGLSVPGVLMSGDHQQIERWRKMQAIGRTYERRPDLLAQRTLSHEENELLDEYLATARSEGN